MKRRVSAVLRVYHQEHGSQPTQYDSVFNRWLSSDEDPVERSCTVSEEWRPLIGEIWLKECSYMLVRCMSTRFDVQPTEEELAQAMSRVLELSLRGDGEVDLEVYPGESQMLSPLNIGRIHVRSRSGSTRCSLVLVPK